MLSSQKRARHQRFWQPLQKGEGGYLAVTALLPDAPEPPQPKDLVEKWLSADYNVRAFEFMFNHTFWGQDAIANAFVNFGPGVLASLLGAPFKLTETSIWFDLAPPFSSLSEPKPIHIDWDHKLRHAIDAQTRALCQASRGRYAVSLTDLGGQYDVLFSLRGEDLLSDMLENPDAVRAAQTKVDDAFLTYFQHLVDLIEPHGCGFTSWMPLLHDRPWYPVQCDLSVMIAPAMFEDFILPALDRVSTSIGQAIYHLDGPEEISHLPMILSLNSVHAIQWVPLPQASKQGASVQHFDDPLSLKLYKDILRCGKKVVLLGVPPDQVATIFAETGGDGVFIYSPCPTRDLAENLIARARREWLRL